MPGKILIKNIEYLITVDDERKIIKDAYLTVDGNLISGIGKTKDLFPDESEYDRVIDAKDMVATPGYINGHCHISYAHATRGIFRDDLGKDYLPNVFTLQGSMNPEEERLTSLLGITELLKYGTTTFVDKPQSIGINAINNIIALIICSPILSTILAKFIQSSCILWDAPSTFASIAFQ